MNTFVKTISILLLLTNGFGAFYGGIQLISDPTGSKLQLPLSYLEHSPFSNYLIPGMILIIVNGLFSFVTIAGIFFIKENFYWLVISQAVLLGGWILIQITLLKMFYAPLHGTFLVIGVILFGCGLYFKKHSQKVLLQE
jgi:ABC-type multidrug transport system permease subunit